MCPSAIKRAGLDRVLNSRVFALNTWFHERSMSEDETGRRSDEPEKGHDGGRQPEQGDTDHKKTRVQRFLGDVGAQFRAEPVYQGEPAKEKGERDEEEGAGNDGIDGEDEDDEGVVSRKVPRVVGDARYGLGRVCWP